MKFDIPHFGGGYDSHDASSLVQRMVPLANIYRGIYHSYKTANAPEEIRKMMLGWLMEISNCMTHELLRFINDDLHQIPEESESGKWFRNDNSPSCLSQGT